MNEATTDWEHWQQISEQYHDKSHSNRHNNTTINENDIMWTIYQKFPLQRESFRFYLNTSESFRNFKTIENFIIEINFSKI